MLTGAAGSIGVSRVVRATADGYTLSVGTLTTHVLIGGLYKLDFDLLTDLTPIAELAYEPLLICFKNSHQPPNDTVTHTPGSRQEGQISLRSRLN
jgi:tripartite-type tricarboxylate transporter receptor subunit TctC